MEEKILKLVCILMCMVVVVDGWGYHTSPRPRRRGSLSSRLNALEWRVHRLHRESEEMIRRSKWVSREQTMMMQALTGNVANISQALSEEIRLMQEMRLRNQREYEEITDEMRLQKRRVEHHIRALWWNLEHLSGGTVMPPIRPTRRPHRWTTWRPSYTNPPGPRGPIRIRFKQPREGRGVVRGQAMSYISGHVEIYSYGQWGTICDDRFDENDAAVICRTGGYSGGIYDYPKVPTNVTKASKIWLDDLACRGTERNVNECPHVRWGRHNCGHSEDVMIFCYVFTPRPTGSPRTTARPWRPTGGPYTNPPGPRGPIRIRFPGKPYHGGGLFGGVYKSFIAGHVEIYSYGQWGTICDDRFDDNDAAVICRTGGYTDGIYHYPKLVQRNLTKASKIWLDDMACRGTERNVNECPGVRWGRHNCGHSEDVKIQCFIGTPRPTGSPHRTGRTWRPRPRTTEGPWRPTGSPGHMRISFPQPTRGTTLVRGGVVSYMAGHVNIFSYGQWGTICDDRFDDNDAAVLCRTGGYSGGVYHYGRHKQRSLYAPKPSKIWLDDLACRGTERNINECPHVRWGRHNCGHSEDVGIMCYIGTPRPTGRPHRTGRTWRPRPRTTERPRRPRTTERPRRLRSTPRPSWRHGDTVRGVGIGSRVRRGPDWSWGPQDKSSTNEGRVLYRSKSSGWFLVRWDNGRKHYYRMGTDGKYDLQLARRVGTPRPTGRPHRTGRTWRPRPRTTERPRRPRRLRSTPRPSWRHRGLSYLPGP